MDIALFCSAPTAPEPVRMGIAMPSLRWWHFGHVRHHCDRAASLSSGCDVVAMPNLISNYLISNMQLDVLCDGAPAYRPTVLTSFLTAGTMFMQTTYSLMFGYV